MAAAPAEVPRTKNALRVVTRTDRAGESISLIEADPGFAEVIPVAEHAIAAGVRLPLVELDAGDWPGPADPDPAVGTIVVSGFVTRTVQRYGRANAEMYGAGDLIPSGEPGEGEATWKVVQDASLVELDERFEIAARRWPALWPVVIERWSQRAERLAEHLAALHLARVDDRLEAVLWQLAERFGKVTPNGVVVPIPLTHRVLGHLVAAKRPTISVALAELAEQGHVIGLGEAGWLLRRPGYGDQPLGSEWRQSSRDLG